MEKLRFGIVGPGRIAQTFADAAAASGEAMVYAAASSDGNRAEEFAEKNGIPKAYAGYEALYQDPNVEAVYIATPHNFHKQNCLDAIAHGKHVLCEKPMVLTQADAAEVFAAAETKGVFIMEAMWTRFLPAMVTARAWVKEGRIGDVRLVKADFCFRGPEDPENRLYKKDLAGGALYDVGVYVIEFMQDFLRGKTLEEIHGYTVPAMTGVDGTDILSFRYSGGALGALSCAVSTTTENFGFIYGLEGNIKFADPTMHNTQSLELWKDGVCIEKADYPFSHGFLFQIDHTARCIREGRLTSQIMPPEDTIQCAAIFDKLMADWGLFT